MARAMLPHEGMSTDLDPNRSMLRRAMARLIAAMMIADRRISADELDEASRLDHLGLGALSSFVREEIDHATRMPIDVTQACSTLSGMGPALVDMVLSVLAHVAASDGAVDDAERRLFATVASALGVGAREITARSGSSERNDGIEPSRPVAARARAIRGDDRANAFRTLGLAAAASAADVDRAYLRLVEDYDPAKVAPLGADFAVLAVRRLEALSDAYEVARDAARGLPPI